MMVDVAVLLPGDGLQERAAVLLQEPGVRSVAVFGRSEEGVPCLQWVAGHPSLEVEYKECGLRFRLDLAKRTSRLHKSQGSFGERSRVRELVQEGERILVLGSGFGLSAILLAKLTPCSEVVGVDLNPTAHEYAEINAWVNGCDDSVSSVLGDPVDPDLLSGLGTFDRICAILPWKRDGVPQTLAELAAPCVPLVKPGGTLHVYTHETVAQLEAGTAEGESLMASVSGDRKADLLWRGKAPSSSIGPGVYRVVWDFKLS